MPNCVRRPERSCGWKTPPHNRRTATDRPSSPGQREVRPGFRLHMVHRNGAKRAWTPYPARKKPGRPQAAWWQGYGPHPGSAGVPSAYMFSRGARSSSISVCLLDRGRTVRKRYHSLLLYPPQLLGSEPGQLFHGQAPRRELPARRAAQDIEQTQVDVEPLGQQDVRGSVTTSGGSPSQVPNTAQGEISRAEFTRP